MVAVKEAHHVLQQINNQNKELDDKVTLHTSHQELLEGDLQNAKGQLATLKASHEHLENQMRDAVERETKLREVR